MAERSRSKEKPQDTIAFGKVVVLEGIEDKWVIVDFGTTRNRTWIESSMIYDETPGSERLAMSGGCPASLITSITGDCWPLERILDAYMRQIPGQDRETLLAYLQTNSLKPPLPIKK